VQSFCGRVTFLLPQTIETNAKTIRWTSSFPKASTTNKLLSEGTSLFLGLFSDVSIQYATLMRLGIKLDLILIIFM